MVSKSLELEVYGLTSEVVKLRDKNSRLISALCDAQVCPDGFGCEEEARGNNLNLCPQCWRSYLEEAK